MSKNIQNNFLFLFFLGLFFSASHHAFAAEITFEVVPNTVVDDTATIVEAFIEPSGDVLNAVEGVLYLKGADKVGVSSVLIETGDSVLNLWPQQPVYTPEEYAIRFTGGKPEGFSKKELLFRMRIFSKKQGVVTLSWIGGSAYRNDGLGTPVGISSRSLTLTLSRGEPNLINPASRDTEPPYFDTVLVSHDPDVYEGKYFVSFHASDDVSGISKYTVAENQVVTETKEGVYVFHDQERESRVIITAYDNAGNSSSVKVPSKYETFKKIVVVSFIIVFMLLVGLHLRRKK